MDIQMDEYFKEAGVNHGKKSLENIGHLTLKKITHPTVFLVLGFAAAISWCSELHIRGSSQQASLEGHYIPIIQ